MHVDVVEAARHGAADDLVLLQRLERLAEMAGDARDLAALREHVVDVPLLRRPRVELPLDAVEAGAEQGRLRQVRVAGRVDGAVLEAAAAGDADEARAVLPAVVLVDRRPEAEVPEALVGVDRRGRDRAERPVVVEDAAHELQPDLGELRGAVRVVEDVRALLVDEGEVVVGAVRGDARERLRHERRDDPVVARDRGADLAVRREVVGRADRPVEEEVQLELARRVLVVAVGRADPQPLAVVDHVEDDRAELLELADVVAPRLREPLGLVRVVRLLEPHHLRLDPAQERVAELGLDLVHDPLQVLARVGLEQLPGLGVVAVAEDARDPRVPRELAEGVEVGDRRELGLLGAEADVAVLAVDEQVGGRAVDELVAVLRDLLPHGRGDALAVHMARDRDLLEEDVPDPVLVDEPADLADLRAAAGVVPRLFQGREGIRHRALREDLLHLGRTLFDDCHADAPLLAGGRGLVDDQDVAVRPVRDGLADALAEQALDDVGLACPDHDHVGATPLGELDDRVGGLAGRRLEVGLDVATAEVLPCMGQLLEVLLEGIGGVERPGAPADRQHHRRDARHDQGRAERLGEIGRPLERPLGRLRLVVSDDDGLHDTSLWYEVEPIVSDEPRPGNPTQFQGYGDRETACVTPRS